ncbi:DUF4249 domain-containing protein [Hufsiella ginkgonis]|uniref:DUF4249 family protein n=1 Tax=Hufsiella ginkgonis TaxID=2695274 RepID=A0A7K1XXA6_9SPHI|nr:DUF4249 domain-containing protein [Hufsiella ginkgonis]MXV15644.1 DUF4249 family protein [Hufsiella ginkgonis]
MNTILRFFSLTLVLGGLSACEEVIDIDLKDSEAKYVIEGVIANEAGACKVLISQSRKFADDNTFPGISGATVTVENKGVTRTLNETGKGIYQNTSVTGIPGETYSLSVKIGTRLFTASCTMPAPVRFDSLYLTRDDFDRSIRYATVSYRDPLNQKNAYRFVQYKNGKKEKSIFVENDEFTQGEQVNTQLDYYSTIDDQNTAFKKGDKVEIEMQCIDAAIYTYWFSLADGASGNGENAAPANPVSNLKGGALGYFSAHTVQRRSLLVR